MAWGDFVPNFLVGRVRGSTRENYSQGDERVSLFNGGEAMVVQGLPLKAALVSLRNSFYACIPIASAFQPVAAMPTTLANLVLHNGEPSTGKSYIIDTVFAVGQTSIAAATSFTQVAQVSRTGIAAPTDNAAVLRSSRTGGVYGGMAKLAVANTAFAIGDKWEMIGCESGHPSTAIGAGVVSELFGGWIVPPGATFCVNLVASTAGGTMLQGVSWHEVNLQLG